MQKNTPVNTGGHAFCESDSVGNLFVFFFRAVNFGFDPTDVQRLSSRDQTSRRTVLGIVGLDFFAMGSTPGVTEFGTTGFGRPSPRDELALKQFLEFFRKILTGFGAYKTGPIITFATNFQIFPAQIESSRPINIFAALNLVLRKDRRKPSPGFLPAYQWDSWNLETRDFH